MGMEYYLYNHANRTYFELGKGPWYDLGSALGFLADPDMFAEWLNEAWVNFDRDSDYMPYFRALGKALSQFIGNATLDRLHCCGDPGDERLYARGLGYICTGSRYGLLDPDKNKEFIDYCNRPVPVLDETVFSNREIEFLRNNGWNLGQ